MGRHSADSGYGRKNMDTALRSHLMAVVTKANLKTVVNMALDRSLALADSRTRVNLQTMLFMERERTNGTMAADTLVSGRAIECTAEGASCLRMGANMMVIMWEAPKVDKAIL